MFRWWGSGLILASPCRWLRKGPLKVNVALVVALPEGAAPQQAQAAARPAGNRPALPGGGRNRDRSLSDYQNSAGEGAGTGGGGASLRIAEGNGAEGPASAEAATGGSRHLNERQQLIPAGRGHGRGSHPGRRIWWWTGRTRRRNGRLWRRPWRPRRWRWRIRLAVEVDPGEVDPVVEVPAAAPAAEAAGSGGGGFGGGGGGARGWSRNRAAVNRIRGNFTEQYTNSAFDAHPYPLNVAESPQIPSYQETFGFSLGGPLVIPHVYRGGNKTSWFASYNLQRGRTGLDSFSTVPTVEEREGNFADTVIASGPYAGTVPTIYDPLSSATGARTPFMGNAIPTARLDSAATRFAAIYSPGQPARRSAELSFAGALAQLQ